MLNLKPSNSYIAKIIVIIAVILSILPTSRAAELTFNKATIFDINQTIEHVQANYDSFIDYNLSLHKSQYTLYNDNFYFVIENHGLGKELWVHDPNTQKETLVRDINVGYGNSSPADFVVFNSKLYFSAFTEESGRELWAFDEATNDTYLVRDLTAGTDETGKENSSNPTELVIYNDKLFFLIDGETPDTKELWYYQPQNDAFTKVGDNINDYYYSKTVFDNKLYIFSTTKKNYASSPESVLIYDGNGEIKNSNELSPLEFIIAEPHLQIASTIYGSSNYRFVSMDVTTGEISVLYPDDDQLYFSKLDSNFYLFEGSIYIELGIFDDSNSGGRTGIELYRYNISNKSLTLAVEIDTTIDYGGSAKSSRFQSIFSYENRLYFTAVGQLNNRKLWSYTPATAEIKKESKDNNINTMSSDPYDLTLYQGYVYFIAQEFQNNFESTFVIWRLNITRNTLERFKTLDNKYDNYYGYTKPELFLYQNKLGYSINTPDESAQLWLYDNVTTLHELVLDKKTHLISKLSDIQTLSNYMYFGNNVFNKDTKTLSSVPLMSASLGIKHYDKFYFPQYNPEYDVTEIWFHDTVSGDIQAITADNFDDAIHTNLEIEFTIGNKLYFSKVGSSQLFWYDTQTKTFNDTIIAAPLKLKKTYSNQDSYIYNNFIYFDYGDINKTSLYRMNIDTHEIQLMSKLSLNILYSYRGWDLDFFEFNDHLYINGHNGASLWEVSAEQDALATITLGNEYEFFGKNELIYHKGKIISSGHVIKDGMGYGNELVVLDMNDAPLFSIAEHQDSYNEGITVALSASNEDNAELTYHWSQLAGPSITFGAIDEVTLSFIAPDVSVDSNVQIQLIVNDGTSDVTITTTFSIINLSTNDTSKSGGGLYWSVMLLFIVSLKRKFFNLKSF